MILSLLSCTKWRNQPFFCESWNNGSFDNTAYSESSEALYRYYHACLLQLCKARQRHKNHAGGKFEVYKIEFLPDGNLHYTNTYSMVWGEYMSEGMKECVWGNVSGGMCLEECVRENVYGDKCPTFITHVLSTTLTERFWRTISAMEWE